MAFFLPVEIKMSPFYVFSSANKCKNATDDTLKQRHHVLFSGEGQSRRQLLLGCSRTPIVWFIALNNCSFGLSPAWGGEESKPQEDDGGVIGEFKSLFDPKERTKSGKVLPKAYLKSVKEVVRTLRESLKEDPNDMSKFRRTADAARESIRGFLGGWRGERTVVHEESYEMLEIAIRRLANFYSQAGPSAPLPENIKADILNDLKKVEDYL
ncbi:hypothetical protein DM860_002412 [Cuscuta australis]|uniref:Photosystem II D1 processing protein PSB27-H2, chloroplastic n=1 Tax=Cuscuta australis TaxID=267555 RepID=A0A328CYR7_9ASTE|nr:hypothetical protein DM860_002412 [Cuscuta australis]